MAKKENLPQSMEALDMEPGSSITYASEVVAIIAGIAAAEVEGVTSMANVPSGNLLGKSRGVTRGVKVEVGTEEVSVDLYMIIEYGQPIQKVAQDAQENVRRAIESMTGLHVVRVDVHVQGVSFEKENNALSAGAKNAVLESAAEAKSAVKAAQAPAAAKPEAPKAAPAAAKPEATPAAEAAQAPEEEAPVAPVQEAEEAEEEPEMMMM